MLLDLPFGKQYGTHAENVALYPAAIRELVRVLRRTGRAVVLVDDANLPRLRAAVADISVGISAGECLSVVTERRLRLTQRTEGVIVVLEWCVESRPSPGEPANLLWWEGKEGESRAPGAARGRFGSPGRGGWAMAREAHLPQLRAFGCQQE